MMKKIISIIFFGIFSTAAMADCYAPNCYGVVGFDPIEKKPHYSTNYPSVSSAKQDLLRDYPNTEHISAFVNGCGAVVYSPTHDMVFSWYSDNDRNDDTVKNSALRDCYNTVNKIQKEKYSGDKRRSKRRLAEKDQGQCIVAAHVCTSRSFVDYYYY